MGKLNMAEVEHAVCVSYGIAPVVRVFPTRHTQWRRYRGARGAAALPPLTAVLLGMAPLCAKYQTS